MHALVVLATALLSQSLEVSGQCISQNDSRAAPTQPTLTHVAPFSLGLFREVLPHEGNFIFSPYSVWMALVLAYLGSGGRTSTQLEGALKLSSKEETLALYRGIDRLYGGVRRGMRSAREKYGSRDGCPPSKGRNRSKAAAANGKGRAGRRCRGGDRRRRPRAGDMQPRMKDSGRGARRRGMKGPKSPRQAQSNANYTISVANRVYIQEGFPLRRCLRRALRRELRVIDFQKSDAAAETINKFVKGATRGKIQKLVEPSLLARARMALVNAVYFKGLWETQFDPKDTRKTPFITAPDARTLTTVDMMRVKGNFKIGLSRELDAEVLEMPYKGGGASMFVLMPRERDAKALYRMIDQLTEDSLRQALKNVREGEAVVALPKFKVETMLVNELLDGLRNLGIRDLFSSEADLSTFSEEERLFLGKGIHKAVVEVTEEGAEAAAATGLIGYRMARSITFVCNRPFLFLIRDNAADNILFMGVFRKP